MRLCVKPAQILLGGDIMCFADTITDLKIRKEKLKKVIKSGEYKGTQFQPIAAQLFAQMHADIKAAEAWIKTCETI